MLGRQGEEETGDDREKEVEEGRFCMNTGHIRVTANPDAEAGNARPVHTGGGLGPALLRAWFQVWKMKLLWSQGLNPGIKASRFQ